MRNLLFASVAALSLGLAGTAMAQSASNIAPSDTRSDIAPRLPAPPVSPNAGPRQFLTAAQSALRAHRTGEAQEALERAESRLLDRSTTNPGVDPSPMAKQVADARAALGHGDVAGAQSIIDSALASPAQQTAAAPMPATVPMNPSGSTLPADAAAGTPAAVAGMPATGMTVYSNGEIPLPSIDDSMTFRGRSGDNSFTVHPRSADPRGDEGPGVDTGN